MDPNVKLDDAALDAALQAAVVGLGELGRDHVVAAAVAEITRTTFGPGGRKEGPLHDAVRVVTRRVALTLIEDKLRADQEFLDFVESVYLHGLRKFMAQDKDKLAEAVATRMSDALIGPAGDAPGGGR